MSSLARKIVVSIPKTTPSNRAAWCKVSIPKALAPVLDITPRILVPPKPQPQPKQEVRMGLPKRYCMLCGCPLQILAWDRRNRENCVRCGPSPRDLIPLADIDGRMFASELVTDKTRHTLMMRGTAGMQRRDRK